MKEIQREITVHSGEPKPFRAVLRRRGKVLVQKDLDTRREAESFLDSQLSNIAMAFGCSESAILP